jgi:hypothetical protein
MPHGKLMDKLGLAGEVEPEHAVIEKNKNKK